MLSYLGYRGIQALARVLPRGVQYRAADGFGDLAFSCSRRSREAILANLRVIAGGARSEAALRRDTRQVFRCFAQSVCEFVGGAGSNAEFLRRCVRVEGRAHVDEALAAGRGCLLVSGHYSSWELGAAALAHLGYPLVALILEQPNIRSNKLFTRLRAGSGVELAFTRQGARACLRALRANRPLAILGDRPTGGPTVAVTLCGRRAEFPQGPWRMALKSGAPVLPTFVRRAEDRHLTLEIQRALPWPAAGAPHEQAAALAQAWTCAFEDRLRADPTQWSAFYPVWEIAATPGPAHTAPRFPAGAPAPVLQEVEAGA